ncbi:hypothetical protein P170DRAFT_479364 [Aspergillus steynii IBT 23096]|uniref:Nucleotidyl transferase AbiEii/AbiGii toxin family protein n=1 Tax=Aspergillus steynii IBT 23096 TaxID=1392250 RepID=A0A2I2FW76_9EURO|nr:uncharacterized protein P170DRAFT_479364 [Aspergillus steynii IBT 23096]PLB44816.1 hypothetical protein P170DRAFT_479364 [Aspergillus steynii IBT 23096]
MSFQQQRRAAVLTLDALRRIPFLKQASIALIGGFAVRFYHPLRVTEDIDSLVHMEPGLIDRINRIRPNQIAVGPTGVSEFVKRQLVIYDRQLFRHHGDLFQVWVADENGLHRHNRMAGLWINLDFTPSQLELAVLKISCCPQRTSPEKRRKDVDDARAMAHLVLANGEPYLSAALREVVDETLGDFVRYTLDPIDVWQTILGV